MKACLNDPVLFEFFPLKLFLLLFQFPDYSNFSQSGFSRISLLDSIQYSSDFVFLNYNCLRNLPPLIKLSLCSSNLGDENVL